MPLELFEEHVLKRHNEKDKLFESEYKVLKIFHVILNNNLLILILQSLGSGLAAEGSIAKLPVNRVKNRFVNIFPCKILWHINYKCYYLHSLYIPNR